MKVYKSLTGYKYLDAGFVHACEAKSIGEHIVVIAKIKHSQRMNSPPLPTSRPSVPAKMIPAIEGDELINFFQKIKDSGDEAALMRVVEPFASEIGKGIQRYLIPRVYDIHKEEYEGLSYGDYVI
ncbi:hypothetical protein JTB14_030669 [Gonioctena quinquepunctata]|nr:hypothetical protein JTB14_030669 [Gonioctena quinquepunctata]